MSSPDVVQCQRQVLRDLAAEYGRAVHRILQARELLKGSVYQMQTRCGNPSCHCAQPRGRRHPATVLSWSEAGHTHIRSIPPGDRDRLRGLTEQYRRLRQARAAVTRLHRQILGAIDHLETALRLPPPAPAARPPAARPAPRRSRG